MQQREHALHLFRFVFVAQVGHAQPVEPDRRQSDREVCREQCGSDEVAQDPFLKRVLKMTAPPGMKVNILTLEETLAAYKAGKFEKYQLLLLVKSPENAKALIDGATRTPSRGEAMSGLERVRQANACASTTRGRSRMR